MFYFLLLIQSISIIVMFFEFSYVLSHWSVRQHAYLLLCIQTALVNIIGYQMEILSTTKEAALAGTKMSYLGKAFLPMFLFLYVTKSCRVELKRWQRNALPVLHFFIWAEVQFCEKNNWFYREIGFSDDGWFPHLVLKHGFLYYIYLALVIIYFFSAAVILLRRFFAANHEEEKKQLQYMVCMIITGFIGIVMYVFQVMNCYDPTVLAYAVATMLMFISLFQFNLLDTVEIAKNNIIENLTDGMVVLDKYDEVMYTNLAARKLFPEFTTNSYGETIQLFYDAYHKEDYLYIADRVYRVECQILYQEKNRELTRGRIYLMKDVTADYQYTERLRDAVREKTKHITYIQHSVIASFADVVEARDDVTGAHIKNTGYYVDIIVKALKQKAKYQDIMTEEYSKMVVEAAALHDIGKISIPDAILKKEGKLTEEEFEILKSHCEIGAKIIDRTLSKVENDEYLQIARDTALYHHEKWNGCGYPTGISGEEIPLCARIMAVADVYDALRSRRSYKRGFSKEYSRQVIEEGSGSHFDPDIVEVFIQNMDKVEQVSYE